MAVVKADGYGHGLVWVARTLSDDVDAFGVCQHGRGRSSCARRAFDSSHLLLEGFFSADELPLLASIKLDAGDHTKSGQLKALEHASPSLKLRLAQDRHRHAPPRFCTRVVPDVLKRLRGSSAVAQVRLMSHFACADIPSDPDTTSQLDCFLACTAGLDLESSLANSSGILAWPQSHFDWVRPGIMLYGASSLMQMSAAHLDLKPVMTLQTALIAVHPRRKGDAIGYGGDWRCPEGMPVGVAAIGYGDGYPRHATSGTPVLVNGKRVPLIGRVSMDMITLDLRTQPQAKVGDPVVLWGQGLPIEDVAKNAGTIAYELMCHVTERIPRVAINE